MTKLKAEINHIETKRTKQQIQELMSRIFILYHKIKTEGTLPNSFYKAIVARHSGEHL